MKTKAGLITTRFYDDGIAKGIQVLLDNELVCMLDIMEEEYEGTRLIVYSKYNEDEPTHIIEVNKKEDKYEL